MVKQWHDVPTLPARKIYEDILPRAISSLENPLNPVPYHPGSPYGLNPSNPDPFDTADPTVGDVHQWNVWGGKEMWWGEYDRMGGRFVSEFGIPSLSSLKTIKYGCVGSEEQAQEWVPPHPQSKIMAQHCRAGSFERRFAIVMNDFLRVSADLEV
jgi:beta-mannosidase